MIPRLKHSDVEKQYKDSRLELLEQYKGNRLKHKTLCFCGKEFISEPQSVRQKTTTSCGCKRKYETKGIKRVKEINNKIYELHKQGILAIDIAKQLNVNHERVTYTIKNQFNEDINRKFKPIIEYDEFNCICPLCNKVKPLSDFGLDGSRAKRKFCGKCQYKKISEKMKNDTNLFLENALYQKKYAKRTRGYEFDLDLDYIIRLFEYQQGKCFYTDQLMSLTRGSGRLVNTLSIDRMDNSKGYIKGNIVFCCDKINSIKTDLTLEELEKWMPEWYKRIKNFSFQ